MNLIKKDIVEFTKQPRGPPPGYAPSFLLVVDNFQLCLASKNRLMFYGW